MLLCMPLKDQAKYNEYMKKYRQWRRYGLTLHDPNEINNKYAYGKIYQIKCNLTNRIYIGSTINELDIRFKQHKSCRNVSSQIILQNNNCIIELIENYNCNSQRELCSREQFYIYNRKCINTNKSIHLFLDTLQSHNKEIVILHYHNESYKKLWITNMKMVIQEFKSRSILPRHIYEFRFVMKELLKCYFKKKVIRQMRRTELITWSYWCLN